MKESIKDYPPEDNAEFRIAKCYRCNKPDMIDKRGLCLKCTYDLMPDLKPLIRGLNIKTNGRLDTDNNQYDSMQ